MPKYVCYYADPVSMDGADGPEFEANSDGAAWDHVKNTFEDLEPCDWSIDLYRLVGKRRVRIRGTLLSKHDVEKHISLRELL